MSIKKLKKKCKVINGKGSISMKIWLYEPNLNNTARYVLGVWGKHPLICFGINPSTAEPNNLDNTLKSVERLAYNNDFDSWIMLNLYSQRSTNPKNVHKEMDKKLHMENIQAIARLLSGLEQAKH